MQAWLEQLWYQPSKASRAWPLLKLLSWLYLGLDRLHFWLKKPKAKPFTRPVVVIGNLCLGGSGKSMLAQALLLQLKAMGLKPGLVARGYGRTSKGLVIAGPGSNAASLGDEAMMLYQSCQVPVAVCNDRNQAVEALLASQHLDLIISDDGLQHYALWRDLEIIMLDGQRGLGNGQLLPWGPLRQSAQSLRHYPWQLIKQQDEADHDQALHSAQAPGAIQMVLQSARLRPLYPQQAPQPPSHQQVVQLVTGIANPASLLASVQQLGFTSPDCHFYPDHYAFTAADFATLSGPILLSAKDAVKCQGLAPLNTWVVEPVLAFHPPQAFDALLQEIAALVATKT